MLFRGLSLLVFLVLVGVVQGWLSGAGWVAVWVWQCSNHVLTETLPKKTILCLQKLYLNSNVASHLLTEGLKQRPLPGGEPGISQRYPRRSSRLPFLCGGKWWNFMVRKHLHILLIMLMVACYYIRNVTSVYWMSPVSDNQTKIFASWSLSFLQPSRRITSSGRRMPLLSVWRSGPAGATGLCHSMAGRIDARGRLTLHPHRKWRLEAENNITLIEL